MNIEQENTFKQAIKDGINVFVGAGFSTMAFDKNGKNLPLANDLCQELVSIFDCPSLDLPSVATILESKDPIGFRNFLTERFSIAEDKVPPIYDNLNLINIKGLYTTNIDNLLPFIIQNSSYGEKYLNDQKENGIDPSPKAINYLPLHGSVCDDNKKFVFSSSSIATIYNNDTRIWNYLTVAIETFPTLFIGYGFNDTGTFNAIFSRNTFKKAQKNKWIVLLKSEAGKEAYYKALGFKIIYGTTEDFLKWIKDIPFQDSSKTTISIDNVFPANRIPNSKYDNIGTVRPIEEFLRGAPPVWHDIQAGLLSHTSYYDEIIDSIHNNVKNTIIIGAPATGKTTIAMQAAYDIKFDGHKLMFSNLTKTRAEYVSKILSGNKALIIIDNFTDDINAFIHLCSKKNLRVVGVDRSHYYEIVSHFIDENEFDIIDVSNPTDQDLQNIYNTLPVSVKSSSVRRKEKNDKYADDTIFEFVIRNIDKPKISDRYKEVVESLVLEDPLLAEFLILCVYAHACRIPLSSEMAISYFANDCNYEDVFEMRAFINDMVKDFEDSFEDRDASLEYYYPKTYFIAECVLNECPKELLKRVLIKFLDNVPPIQICNYNTFKKHGFDKGIINHAFSNSKEGREFYEKAFLYDYENPFVLQQGALYLSGRKQYREAFDWIDRARNMTNDRYTSIRNSHAIILFDANKDKKNDSNARAQMDNSMNILQKCIDDDRNSTFHAIRYAQQAIEYFNMYNDAQAIQYLNNAAVWLTQKAKVKKGNSEIKRNLNKINEILNTI